MMGVLPCGSGVADETAYELLRNGHCRGYRLPHSSAQPKKKTVALNDSVPANQPQAMRVEPCRSGRCNS